MSRGTAITAARRPRFAAAWLAVAALALGACAETELIAHTAKQLGRDGGQTAKGGRYKIGSPYKIAGRWYYPAEDYNYRETGIASWYGPKFHGRRTANGEIYDMNELTAAHRTLPMPSVVRVTNLENGRSMVLRVNDRGPFARGRIIDVSRRAAQLLGFRRQGTAKVRVAIMADDSRRMKLAALNSPAGRTQQVQVAAAPRVAVEAAPLPGHASAPDTAAAPRQSTPPPRPVRGEPQLPTGVMVLPVSPSGIYVQAGAYARLENALKMRDRLYTVAPAQISRFTGATGAVYRVRIGPLNSVAAADRTLARIVQCCMGKARIVVE